MPQLNLQQLLNGDTINSLINKINDNFNQITSIGGGPQGKRGEQGPPGLPGLRGIIGNSGDAGEDGTNVTLVGADPNWPTLYAGSPTGNTSANAAIIQGYLVGDIWIDNGSGTFYVIEETYPGVYEFIPYPISITVVATGDLWSIDTDSDINTDDNKQGVRINNRYATLSLTSLVKSGQINGTSSDSIDIFANYQNSNGSVSGYERSAYKISIDNTFSSSTSNDIQRVKTIGGTLPTLHYGVDYTEMSPLIYLTNTGTNTLVTPFGLLHQSFNSGGVNLSILTLFAENNTFDDDQFFINVSKVGLKKDLYFKGVENEDVDIRWVDIDSNGDKLVNSINSLSLSIATQNTLNAPPSLGNPHINEFGIELRKYKDGVLPGFLYGGIINFSGFNDTSSVHTMTITRTGSLLIGNNKPNSGNLSITDDDDNARLVLWKKGTSVLKFRRDNVITNNWNIDFDSTDDRFKLNRDTSELFTVLSNGFVGIGQIAPIVKLDVSGEVKIDDLNLAVLQGEFLVRNIISNIIEKRAPNLVRTDIGAVGGSSVAGRVAFWDSTNTINGNNNFWWDIINERLAIGNNAPQDKLHIFNGNLRFSDGSFHEILSAATLNIRTYNTGSNIQISTQDSAFALAPTGNITLTPGTNTVGGTSGVIKLERRVQVIKQTPTSIRSASQAAQLTQDNWLNSSGSATQMFTTWANATTYFLSRNYDRIIYVKFPFSWNVSSGGSINQINFLKDIWIIPDASNADILPGSTGSAWERIERNFQFVAGGGFSFIVPANHKWAMNLLPLGTLPSGESITTTGQISISERSFGL
jgi:hypothetical protein